ncbi:uncharacterized protein LOC131841845 isoform X2 [Achroia grisella]|nr:uncharacterized protein LOC131841845 isoform X2 [Achroia grisella]
MKKNFKPKILYEETEQTLYFTPLQKARQALRDALKNAAQEMFTQNLPRQFCSIRFEPEDGQDDYCEDEDNIEFDWFTNNEHKNTEEFPQRATDENTVNLVNNETFENSSQDNLMDFNDETSQQNNDNFSVQFLSMPELDPEPEANRHIELLAGFDIENNTHQNTITKIVKENEHHSLNCVLPSISNDATISSQMEKINDDSNHYHGEWDQMFSDMITYKSPNQECGSDLKELYSQISKTIDLLNS